MEHFFKSAELRENVVDGLRNIGDLERLVSKVACQRIQPREVVQLHTALRSIGPIKKLCAESGFRPLWPSATS